MSSIFDNLTVPGASLDVPGPTFTPQPMSGGDFSGLFASSSTSVPQTPAEPAAPAASPAGGWKTPAPAAAQPSALSSVDIAPAAQQSPIPPPVWGSTGLVASMEPAEFTKLVHEAGSGTVLQTTVQMSQPRRSPGGPPGISRRYFFPHGGIVYVTLSHAPLNLGTGVRVVNCLAVSYEGKPLGGSSPVI